MAGKLRVCCCHCAGGAIVVAGCEADGTRDRRVEGQQQRMNDRIDARTAGAEDRAERTTQEVDDRVNQRIDGTLNEGDRRMDEGINRGLDRIFGGRR